MSNFVLLLLKVIYLPEIISYLYNENMYYLLLLPVLYIIVKMLKSSTPRGFAKELISTQIKCFSKIKNAYPNLGKKQLYTYMISLRPGFDKNSAAELVLETKRACNETGYPFCLRAVVLQLLAYEYLKRTNNPAIPMKLFTSLVNEKISKND